MEQDSLSVELPVDSCERDLHKTARLWWQPYIYFKHEVETSSFSVLSLPIIFGTKTPGEMRSSSWRVHSYLINSHRFWRMFTEMWAWNASLCILLEPLIICCNMCPGHFTKLLLSCASEVEKEKGLVIVVWASMSSLNKTKVKLALRGNQSALFFSGSQEALYILTYKRQIPTFHVWAAVWDREGGGKG